MKFYVYAYYDDDVPVYIGKGQHKRAWEHLRWKTNKGLWAFINGKKNAGIKIEPKIIFRTDDEIEAYAYEAALIENLGRRVLHTGSLFNLIPGYVTSTKLTSIEKIQIVSRSKILRTEMVKRYLISLPTKKEQEQELKTWSWLIRNKKILSRKMTEFPNPEQVPKRMRETYQKFLRSLPPA